MAYIIDRAHKLVKQKINQLGITTHTSSAPSNPSNSHINFMENTDIRSNNNELKIAIIVQPLI